MLVGSMIVMNSPSGKPHTANNNNNNGYNNHCQNDKRQGQGQGQGQGKSIKNMVKPLPYYPPGAYLPITGSGPGLGSGVQVGLTPTMIVKKIVNPNHRNYTGPGPGQGLGLAQGQGLGLTRGASYRGATTAPYPVTVNTTRAASVGMVMSRQSLLSRSTDLQMLMTRNRNNLQSGSNININSGSVISSSSQIDSRGAGAGFDDYMEFDDDRLVVIPS